ncbi:glycerate kinase [Metabacillus idriensis]|uniref:Glycerate kinase n=1 Tax=Metabacillus idriensis TaxID=324768 RepID=A0A6I2M5I8_9BACI|nr:glycerate kinase [Metabacillus idriensis]MCM3594780.1 glycerate kinase [Metabacillus idriensis]MRX53199.1 glycerate kinase [Metabacillus idriensis]
MKIVIAPDSFKESMTALEVCEAIERGLRRSLPEVKTVKIPMADGGEGTVQALVDATGGTFTSLTVTGPLGLPVEAEYGWLGDLKTAVIEMAAASGLHLVPPERRNPLMTTTAGTGELIKDAVQKGAEHLIIGIGGSATNDGGMGMAQALGVKFLDAEGADLPYGGGAISKLARIDVSGMMKELSGVTIDVACDVDNPLTGPNGASAIFGPQKGATDETVSVLDQNLSHYASLILKETGMDVEKREGSGAAGGLGAGLLAFLNANLKRGADIVIETVQLEKHMSEADLVITGEGRIDGQTIHGKTPVGVSRAAKKLKIPVIAIAGSIGDGYESVYDEGIGSVFSIVPGIVSLEEALQKGPIFVENLMANLGRVLNLKK